MSRKDKLIERLKSHPRDFTFEEAEALLGYFGYRKIDKGKTSGSRVMFYRDKHSMQILLHKPHPCKELRNYQVKQLLEVLEKEGLI